MYLDNKVCCMINNTAAEMVIALFWLIKPKTIKKTNNNAIILNCNVIIPLNNILKNIKISVFEECA